MDINKEILAAWKELESFFNGSDYPLEQVLEVMAVQLSGTQLFPEDCDRNSKQFEEIIPQIEFLISDNAVKQADPKPEKTRTQKTEKVKVEKVEKTKKVKVEKTKKVVEPKNDLDDVSKIKMQGYANKGLKYGVRTKYDFIEDGGEVFKLGERVLIDTKDGEEEVTIRHIQVIGFENNGKEKVMYDLFRDPGKPTPTAGRMLGKIRKIKN